MTQIQKLNSIRLCLSAHPDNTPNSEFADRISDLDELIKNAITANGMREWTDERVGQAMREYADQQNAELDKMGEHLSAENSDLSSQIEGLKYGKERLREIVKELESQLAKYRKALERIMEESWSFERPHKIAKEALKQEDEK